MYAILCLSLAVGLSSGVFSNYFKEVFAVDSVQRGLLEIPRETPGILCVVILTALSGLGNLSLMVMAYGFCTLGLAVLGLLSPSYFIMQIFLFSFSLGEHMMMPLRDSIAMDLSGEGKTGTFLGQVKGKMTLASMAASAAVFIGYRTGIFWFGDGVIPSFVAGLLFTAAGLFFAVRACGTKHRHSRLRFNGTWLLAPVLAMAVRLVLAYRVDSVNPALEAYYVELLALVFLNLAFYRFSSFSFDAGRTRRFALYACCAVVLCLAAFCDSSSLSARLLEIGAGLCVLGFLLLHLTAASAPSGTGSEEIE